MFLQEEKNESGVTTEADEKVVGAGLFQPIHHGCYRVNFKQGYFKLSLFKPNCDGADQRKERF